MHRVNSSYYASLVLDALTLDVSAIQRPYVFNVPEPHPGML
jgi:hypothetical protein